MKITKEQAKEMIFASKGKIFTATFVKKDGTIREMTCRREVKKGVKGVGLAYDPAKFELIPVFDMKKEGFRMIQAKTITNLNINGEKFEVAQQPSLLHYGY